MAVSNASRLSIRLAVSLLTLALAVLLPLPAAAQTVIRGPVLQPCHATPDVTCARVTLWTDVPAPVAIKYGPSPLETGGDLWTANTLGALDTPTNPGGYRHVHTLVGLQPGGNVQYEVWVAGVVAVRSNGLPHSYVFDALGGGADRCYAVMADWSNKSSQPFETWRDGHMAAWGCRGLITAGDNSYVINYEGWPDWDSRFYRAWLPAAADKTPWLASTFMLIGIGNHDNSAIFKSVFPSTYRVHDDPVSIIHVVTCGSCGSNASYKTRLIEWGNEAVLRGNIPVFVFHYPMFPCSYTDAAAAQMQTGWKPIFESLARTSGRPVVVINGHEHGYARSHPHNGVTYITTGGASDGAGFGAGKNRYCLAGGLAGKPSYARPAMNGQQIGKLSISGTTVKWESFPNESAETPHDPPAGQSLVWTAGGAPPPPPPAPTLTASPTWAWEAQHADRCTLDGQATGATGSAPLTPGTHTLVCTGASGTVSRTVTIQEGAP